MDEEKLQKRKEQRQQRQQANKRKFIIKLIVAAMALVLVAVLIVVLVRPGEGSSESGEATVDPSKTTVIHVAAVGDLNVTERLVKSAGVDQDYSGVFLDVAHLLGDADIAVMNFEGVMVGEPYGESKSAPLAMMQALSSAGVDIVQLANSYSIYKGVSGLAKTIENVRLAGMEPLGAYGSNEEQAQSGGYVLCETQGVKIAFVAFTKGMDGMALPAGSEKCVNVLYKDYSSTYKQVDTEGITAVLSAAKEEDPDLIIAMVHWGSEFNDTLSDTQTQIKNILQANGADAVIGTHSHYVQEMELKDGKFVAYSLGDFVSDAQRAGSEYSVVLDLEITKDKKSGKTKISNFSYTPIFSVVEEEMPTRVMRIKEAMTAFDGGYLDKITKGTYDKMTYALERIEKRINPEEE